MTPDEFRNHKPGVKAMSAFVVSKGTMDRVLWAINAETNGNSFAGHPTHTAESMNALGRDLYAMNLAAVLARYPSDTKESAPGPGDLSDIHENYRWNMTGKQNKIANFKAVQCLLYQASEGDVPKTSPLFAALKKLEINLAFAIVSDLHEYRTAPWDSHA